MAENDTSNVLYPAPWLAQVTRDLAAGAVAWALLYRTLGRTAGYQPADDLRVNRDDVHVIDSSDESELPKAIASSLWGMALEHWALAISPKHGTYGFAPIFMKAGSEKQGATFTIGGTIRLSTGETTDADGGRLVAVSTAAADKAFAALHKVTDAASSQLAKGYESLTAAQSVFDALLGTTAKIAERLDERADGKIEIAKIEAETKLQYVRDQGEHARRSQIIEAIKEAASPFRSDGVVAVVERVAGALGDRIVERINGAGTSSFDAVGAAQLGRASGCEELPSLAAWLDAGLPPEGQIAADLRSEWLAVRSTMTLGSQARAILDALAEIEG